MKKSRLLGAVCACSFSALSNAALIDMGNITYDEDTNQEWLDVTETVGMSYAEVLASTYVTQDGFRYATEAELITLYNNAGGGGNYYNTNGGTPIAANYNAAMLLLDFMGCTSYVVGADCDRAGQDWHIGMFGPEVSSGYQTASVVDAYNPPEQIKAAMWLDYVETGPYPSRTTDDWGSYLVRTAVPIPPALWLFSSGLLGLVGMARRKA